MSKKTIFLLCLLCVFTIVGRPGHGTAAYALQNSGGSSVPSDSVSAVRATAGYFKEVDPLFWQNMDDFIFGVVQPSDVKLYVTFLDGNHYSHYPEHRALGAEIVRKPESFINNVLLPFLQRYNASGTIWGVDLVNEPEAMIAGNTGNWAAWGVTWDEMRNFLKTCTTAIHAYNPDIKVSAGSGWHNWTNIQAGRFNNLGFDFVDFHYYHDAPHPAFPTAQQLGVTIPVVLGECGQAGAAWDDTLQYNSVSQALANAESAGYAAALSWYYNYAGSTDKHTHLNANGSWRPVMSVFASYAGHPDFLAGTNLSWLSGAYRHDFGPNPLYPTWPVGYARQTAQDAVDDYVAAGMKLMRLFLFEGQEAIPFYALFHDFEKNNEGWGDLEPVSWAVAQSRVKLHASDGLYSLLLTINTRKWQNFKWVYAGDGWYGIKKIYGSDTPLNLQPMKNWTYYAYNNTGRAIGVNLAFTVQENGVNVTYQTRSGTSGGQLWLANNTGAGKTVTLEAANFSEQWARADNPNTGVARPADDVLKNVKEIYIRVYLSNTASSPVANGKLYLDGVRIE
ncbi:MAG: hypothetical protein EHM45_09875 [Desulfobacteraceae bacterium]|nr:MAG: hypothetical protein EHM45_09875 [Desulfobacteraceae bacterium]